MNPELLTVIVTCPGAMPSNTAFPARSVNLEREGPEDGVTQTEAPEITVVVVPTSTLRVADVGTCGTTCNETVLLVPPPLAVMVTVAVAGATSVETSKVWVREFAGTVMVDGTVAMEVLLLERLTTNPPLAAAEDKVTVPPAKRGLFTKE